jgi:general secretion pathway protein G
MVIIGLLAALVAPRLIGTAEKQKVNAAKAQMRNLATALDLFRMEVGRYPTDQEGLEALRQKPSGVERWNGPYLNREVPKDPWGHDYIYSSANGSFELMSHGADGVSGGEGDDKDILWQ